MLSPETFARVIAAAGEAARPVLGDTRLYHNHGRLWRWDTPRGGFIYIYQPDAHNACSVHWLGMEAEAKRNLNAYFVDGKVDIDKLAAAVIEHAKEGT